MCSSLFSLMLVLLIGLGLGAIAGVNIPDGTACYRDNLACRWLRIRHPKMIL
ncbi:hypothetical protein [Chroococcus sp. FPU101]|uniref:hypothetical protein n=1 Tax=Chroococcus sp. FPU101 TaxID=1974212 RepID=UPI001A8FBDB3|nr:hypothetical protein [Chroococcus sp. FPU101]